MLSRLFFHRPLLSLEGVIFYHRIGSVMKKATGAGFDGALTGRGEHIFQKGAGHGIGCVPHDKNNGASKGVGGIEDGLVFGLNAIDKEQPDAIAIFSRFEGRTHGDIGD